MSIDLKFVELTADVPLKYFLQNNSAGFVGFISFELLCGARRAVLNVADDPACTFLAKLLHELVVRGDNSPINNQKREKCKENAAAHTMNRRCYTLP